MLPPAQSCRVCRVELELTEGERCGQCRKLLCARCLPRHYCPPPPNPFDWKDGWRTAPQTQFSPWSPLGAAQTFRSPQRGAGGGSDR